LEHIEYGHKEDHSINLPDNTKAVISSMIRINDQKNI